MKIGRRFTTAMVLLAFGFSLTQGITSFFYTQKLLETSIYNELNNESIIAAHTLGQALDTYSSSVQSLSRNPLIVNALLDSREREAYLSPFIRSYELAGEADINLALTDFSGLPIALKGPTRDYTRTNWKTQVIDNAAPVATIDKRDGRVILILAYPVIYPATGFPEGMMVAELDLQTVISHSFIRFTESTTVRLTSADSGIDIGLKDTPTEATSFSAINPLIVNSPVSTTNLFITASKPAEYLNAPLRDLIINYVVVGILLLLTVLISANWISKYLTRPVTQLSEFARTASRKDNIDTTVPWQGNDEIGVLAKTLEVMLKKQQSAREDLENKVHTRTQELQSALSQLNTLINNNPAGILFEDHAQKIKLCNDQLTNILSLELSSDEILKKDNSQLVSLLSRCTTDPELFTTTVEQRYVERTPSLDEEILLKNGHTLERDYVPIKVEDTFLGHMWLYRDISERKKVDQLKSEFVSVVSHELRTPLTSIRGSLSLLAGGVVGTLPEQIQRLINIALRNSERLITLVNDILDMDKIASGKMRFDLQPHSLPSMIKQSLQDNKAYAEQFGVTLSLKNEIQSIELQVDRDRFIQVMSNLLSNAAKFSPENGIVEIGAIKNDSSVTISVTDYGQGIPEQFRKHIFQKFSQADATDTRQKGGSGLGLAITKALVEKMSASIDFESQVGKGTTFTLCFPVYEK